MTDVKKNKNRLINSKAEARALYVFAEAKDTGKIGIEVEMALYKQGADKPEIPQAAEMMRMQTELKTKGYDAQLEAAGVLEYASLPVRIEDVAELVAQARQDLSVFEQAAARQGYTRAPWPVLPTTTLDDALKNRVDRERLNVAIESIPSIYHVDAIKVPLLTAGVQASFSPRDEGEMYRMLCRGYALTPLLLASMNSHTGYTENEEMRKDYHVRSSYYAAHCRGGGIAESFNAAASPQELIERHIDTVYSIPMFFAYDLEGKIIATTKDDVLTFEELVRRGLNTQSNYELAESFLYHDIKICNLRDAAGDVIGKRVEVRNADSGLHQPASVLLLTAALMPDGKTADAFDALLKGYGFTGNPKTDAPLLKEARDAATQHGGRYMDVPFGVDPATGKGRSLRELAADVASLMEEQYGAEPKVAAELSRLTGVLLSGDCDAKRTSRQYPTLGAITSAMQKGHGSQPPASGCAPRSVT